MNTRTALTLVVLLLLTQLITVAVLAWVIATTRPVSFPLVPRPATAKHTHMIFRGMVPAACSVGMVKKTPAGVVLARGV